MDRFEFARPLRAALEVADYSYDGVAGLLGATAHAALSRNETTPGLRRTSGGSPTETLVRLFLLQTPVSLEAAETALPGLVDPLCNAGILEQSVSEVAARLDVRPYADGERDLWIVSDLTPGLDGTPNRVGPDHVLGISSASSSLAQLTLRDPAGRALDLGTGCGVQALHLASHCSTVVATDVNPRALWMTQLNDQLNRSEATAGRIETRSGSFFEPVRDERFDLIATNPPFVISPASGERLVYRDSGLPGDRVVEDIVRAAPEHLVDGGWCQILANWVVVQGRSWDERLASWIDDGCDAFVVQREVVDPATYVELWLKDAGLQGSEDYLRRYDTWLAWFDDQHIDAVGFGWINLRKVSERAGATEFLEWPYDIEQPIAPALGAWGDAIELESGWSDSVWDLRFAVRHDVQQETHGEPGAAEPSTLVLRQTGGLRRARQADTVEAALVGACDGELTLAQIVAALAELLDLDPEETRRRYLPVVGELVREGFLAPSD